LVDFVVMWIWRNILGAKLSISYGKLCMYVVTVKKLIKVLMFSQGLLDTNYSISLTIIEGIRKCVPLDLGWWMNQEQPPTNMRGMTTLIAV